MFIYTLLQNITISKKFSKHHKNVNISLTYCSLIRKTLIMFGIK